MKSILQFPDKGYDIEISLDENAGNPHYIADIKYPCGELVEGAYPFHSKRNAVYWAVCKLEGMPFAYHDCKDEFCQANSYLRHFRGKHEKV